MSNKILIPSLIVATVAIAAMLFFTLGGTSISSPRLPSAAYMERPSSFEAGVYSLNVSVSHQVATRNGSRLFIVNDLDSNLPLPIIIPDNNFETFLPNQRFIFEVKVVNNNLKLINSQKR